ncbi:MAG: GTPase ObgE, partial [Pseudomonadota bacterium]|nr:GTPase ObgE [Pseudomonadota bacterium]
GLGDRFLGHVERCGALLHLIDGADDDPISAYDVIRSELVAYGGGLAEKPEVVALNKLDALGAEDGAALLDLFEEAHGFRPHLISGVAGSGMDGLLRELHGHVVRARAARAAEGRRVRDVSEDGVADGGAAGAWQP